MEQIVVLVIVFLAVLIFALEFLPSLFVAKPEKKPANVPEVIDDPVRRFIEPEDLRRMQCSGAMIIAVIGIALVIVFRLPWALLVVLALSFLAYIAPWLNIRRKIHKRNVEFESGMLDFTILISNTLRAGIALPAAIEMAIQSVGGAMQEEFTLVLREHQFGVDLADAIERLTKRIESENLQLFSATVCVTMRTGGSMADVLDHVVATIRQRAAFQDKLKTLIAQAELEALLISLSPLAAFILLYCLDRELMTPVVTTPIGQITIFAIIVWETIGFFVLKKVTKVKY